MIISKSQQSASTPAVDESASKPSRRIRRGLAVVTMVVAGLMAGVVAASPASAANYDHRGYLVTPSRADAVAGVNCDQYSGKLALTFAAFGGTAPHYYRYAVKYRYDTSWSNWSGWGAVGGSRFTQFPIITTRGDWQVVVSIAHNSNGVWYYDTEYTSVSNDHPLYNNSPYCHVGG